MEPEDWWYFVKVLRALKKRLYKDVKSMSMIEKKTFFKVRIIALFFIINSNIIFLVRDYSVSPYMSVTLS